MSSVAPTDSASNQGRRSKPGKRERLAARSAIGSTGGTPASPTKAAAFATGVSDPVPQPGKFPVVFPTGAGEPSRDQDFAISFPGLSSVLVPAVERYRRNARYAEFRAHSELTDAHFAGQLSYSFLLRVAQQIVHSHVNMGLPQGDYASIASSEVLIPQALAAVARQIGEYSIPSVGTRYLLKDYDSAVRRAVFCAQQVFNGGGIGQVLARSWLPMSNNDGNFKAIVGNRLNQFLSGLGVSLQSSVLEDAVLSGARPDVYDQIKDVLGEAPGENEPDPRDRFDFIFEAKANVGQFTTTWTTANATACLAELGLSWPAPNAGQLNWDFNAKQTFASLADSWSRLSATYTQFFELSSGLANRSEARGSPSQMAEVTSVSGVTIVKTFMALSAPEFSLVACFPVSAVYVGGIDRRVVVTTSLNVSQRATEFCQLDWR